MKYKIKKVCWYITHYFVSFMAVLFFVPIVVIFKSIDPKYYVFDIIKDWWIYTRSKDKAFGVLDKPFLDTDS